TDEFYQHTDHDTNFAFRHLEIYRVCLDKNDQLWVSVFGMGPALFDRHSGKFKLVKRDTTIAAQKDGFIYDLYAGSDGKIWTGSGSGFYWIDPTSRKIIPIPATHPLHPFSTTGVNGFGEDSRHRLWMSTENGVLCFDRIENTVSRYGTKEGLLDDHGIDMMVSSKDDIYICMAKGFNIIHPNGNIESY